MSHVFQLRLFVHLPGSVFFLGAYCLEFTYLSSFNQAQENLPCKINVVTCENEIGGGWRYMVADRPDPNLYHQCNLI